MTVAAEPERREAAIRRRLSFYAAKFLSFENIAFVSASVILSPVASQNPEGKTLAVPPRASFFRSKFRGRLMRTPLVMVCGRGPAVLSFRPDAAEVREAPRRFRPCFRQRALEERQVEMLIGWVCREVGAWAPLLLRC